MKKRDNINIEEAKSLISEVERTMEYDKERISELHDHIFGKDNRPRTSDPCPIMQMRKIKAWYQDKEL